MHGDFFCTFLHNDVFLSINRSEIKAICLNKERRKKFSKGESD